MAVIIALLDELAIALLIFIAAMVALYRLEILGLAEILILSAIISVSVAFLLVKLVRAQQERIKVGPESYIGMEAEVVEASGRRGMVMVEGELWKAESDESLMPGDKVVIVGRSSNLLKVRKKIS